MDVPEERELSLDAALSRSERDLRALGLTVDIERHGSGPHLTLAHLRDPGGNTLALGLGKGHALAAEVGARFEALEHLLSSRYAHAAPVLRCVDELLAAQGAEAAGQVPFALLADQREETMACHRFSGMEGQGFDYPIALSFPDYVAAPLPGDTFDYAGLKRYSCNSGLAIGSTLDEALLHALNECIERDALSLFLIRHFFYADPGAPRVVATEDSTPDIQTLHQQVCGIIQADVTLLDISTEFGVTCCVATDDLVRRKALFGAGASLDPALAARRALYELLQSHLGMLEHEGKTVKTDPPEHCSELLRAWPSLQRCLQFDVQTLLRTHPAERVGLRPRPLGSLREQIRCITQQLHEAGLTPGYRVVHSEPSGTVLVNVVVPGLERFFLVMLGNVVAPGQRGVALIQSLRTVAGCPQEQAVNRINAPNR